jgi:hypothetical protein
LSGSIEEARKIYLRALQIALDAHSTPIALDSLLGLARLQAQAGKIECALELSYYILNHPSITQETRDHAIEVCNKIQKKLTDIQIQATKEVALSRTFEEILNNFLVEYA